MHLAKAMLEMPKPKWFLPLPPLKFSVISYEKVKKSDKKVVKKGGCCIKLR